MFRFVFAHLTSCGRWCIDVCGRTGRHLGESVAALQRSGRRPMGVCGRSAGVWSASQWHLWPLCKGLVGVQVAPVAALQGSGRRFQCPLAALLGLIGVLVASVAAWQGSGHRPMCVCGRPERGLVGITVASVAAFGTGRRPSCICGRFAGVWSASQRHL